MIRHVGQLGMDQLESRNYIGYLARVQRHHQFSCCWCFLCSLFYHALNSSIIIYFCPCIKHCCICFFMPFIFPYVMKKFSFKFHVFSQGLYYNNIVTIIV